MSRGKRKLKRSLGRGNEAEEVQTPDFYNYILYFDWNKENNPRLLNIPAKTEDKKY